MRYFLSSKLKKQRYKIPLYSLLSLAIILLIWVLLDVAVEAPRGTYTKAKPSPAAPQNLQVNSPPSPNQSKQNSQAINTLPLVFSHTSITTTIFWVGEGASSDNGGIANAASAWDEQWQQHFGGFDDPDRRNSYYPAAFTPKENPFYIALPYNDALRSGHKSSAINCPMPQKNSPYSWCKNSWVAIRHSGKIVYAQWEDVGPFEEDDLAYVFGSANPRNKRDTAAGLDVSPAVRDYLGLSDVDKTDWAFVDSSAVPAGPWKNVVTTNPGETL